MCKNYIQFGNVFKNGDEYVFESGSTGNGLCFKNEDNYLNHWDEPCYVPEYGFPDKNESNDNCDYYTHRSLLTLCHHNHKLCDAVFYAVDWQYPETYLDELSNSCDFKDFWSFVKPGTKVIWNDPANETTGTYTVHELKDFSSDDDEWYMDNIVLIGNGITEAEVFLSELQEII